MPIVQCPDNVAVTVTARCIVCDKNVPLRNMTIGLPSLQDDQGFICSGHLGRSDSSRFLRKSLSLFEAREIKEGEWDG